MKILMIDTCYNELYLLRYKIEHCLKNNIDLYLLDNMSNDGSIEYMDAKKINYVLVDTGASFHLSELQQAMTNEIHSQKPDWVIYGAGIDMFFEAQEGIRGLIEKADAEGFSQIELPLLQIENVGEPIDTNENPFNNHFYCLKKKLKRTLICKYNESVKLMPETVYRDKVFVKRISSGVIFEMRASKSPAERTETLARRERAWERGLNREYGSHYQEQAKHNFTFKKSDCHHIRHLPEYALYQKLQNL